MMLSMTSLRGYGGDENAVQGTTSGAAMLMRVVGGDDVSGHEPGVFSVWKVWR